MQTKLLRFGWVAGVVCALGSAAQIPPIAPWEARLPPPCPWGLPLSNGPIRVVIAGPERAARDMIELGRRLDVKLHPALFPDDPRRDAQAIEHLREGLGQAHDVVVLGNLDLSRIPSDLMDGILNSIADGKGLVVAQYNESMVPPRVRAFLETALPVPDTGPVTNGIGHQLTPEWQDGLEFVHLYTGENGQGRIVWLDYGEPAPKTHFLITPLRNPLYAELEYLDVYFSLVAKAIRWASGRVPEGRVSNVAAETLPTPDPSEIPPDFPKEYIELLQQGAILQPYQTFVVHLTEPLKRGWRLRAQLRRPGRNWQTTVPARTEGSTSRITVFAGPGACFLDMWITNRKNQVIDWHTESVTILGTPQFKSVRFSKTLLYPNDALDIVAELEGVPAGRFPPTLYARAYDSYGRLVAESLLPSTGESGRISLRLGFADLAAPRVKIECFAAFTEGKKPTEWDLRHAAYQYAYVPVHLSDPRRPLRLVVRHEALAEYNQRRRARALTWWGVDAVYTPVSEPAGFYCSEAGLWPVFEAARYVPEVVLDRTVRVPSFADPDFQQAESARLQDIAIKTWGADSAIFSLGDGNCLAQHEENVCQSRQSLEEFREVLAHTYGDVEKLNAVWNTQFDRWAEVAPAPEDVAEALGVYAPWLDFRRYMDCQFEAMHVLGASAIRRVRPDAAVGFVAAQGETPYLGYDWHRLSKSLRLICVPFEPVTLEKVRSYKRKDTHAALSLWDVQSDLGPNHMLWLPWYAVLHGFDSIWWNDETESGGPGALAPDSELPTLPFETLCRNIELVNGGFAALFRDAQRQPHGVAVYDSQASRYLSHVLRDAPCSTQQAEGAFLQAIKDMGLQCVFVSPEEAVAGTLTQHRVLVLPSSWALSDDEMASIRAFHAGGGHVLADFAPGAFDEHGNPRRESILKDIFDTETTNDAEIPAHWAVARRGNAVAAVIGNVVSEYGFQRQEDAGAVFREHLAALLTEMGIEFAAQLQTEDRRPFDGEITAWKCGDADIISVLADPCPRKKMVKGTLTFAASRRPYDAMTGRRLAASRKLRIRLAPGTAAIYSFLPYEVTRLELQAPKRVTQGARLPVRITIKTRTAPPGLHPVCVELKAPAGQPIRQYSQTLSCRDGSAETYLPLAMNEPVGPYLLRVRDVLTGMTAETMIVVTGAGEETH